MTVITRKCADATVKRLLASARNTADRSYPALPWATAERPAVGCANADRLRALLRLRQLTLDRAAGVVDVGREPAPAECAQGREHVVAFVGPDESRQASTICGGGRYDYLIEEIGGPPTPGIGFGAGIERLVLSLELEGITADSPELDVVLVADAEEHRAEILRTLGVLRERGASCDTDYAGRSMKGQLTQAQKRAKATAIRTADGWTLRRRGEPDRDAATLEELL